MEQSTLNQQAIADTQPSPHIVVVSSPGMGHITPLAELTRLLVLSHRFTATIVTLSDLPSSLPPSTSIIQLPLPDLPTDADTITRVLLTMYHSVSPLREILIFLRRTTRLVAIIFDHLGIAFLSMAKQLAIPSYLFITSNLFFLSFALHLPSLVETTTVDRFRDLPEPLRLPGCVPLKGEDFMDLVEERESESTAWIVRNARQYDHVDGILVNSFEALEAGAAKFLKKMGDGRRPPVWPIGPLVESRLYQSCEEPLHECMEWLNQQPSDSVVFVCFGSGGALSWEQTRELALGLEMSGQRFLWVVRAGRDTGLSGSFLNPNQSGDDPAKIFPKGFVERTKDRGMMVTSWAPQRDVLGHRSTGGFVSHCGWNSTLESMVNGVPMVAWPLHSEQRMNAVLLVEGAKVALRVRVGEDRVVRKEEVAAVVQKLMVGEEGRVARNRMQGMKKEALKAVEKEGSSFTALEEVVGILKGSHGI